MTPEEIKKRLPSMYHQFIELAEVDITKDMMEVGPTATTSWVVSKSTRIPAPARPRACSPRVSARAVCTGSNRLGGNSLSRLLVFGDVPGSVRPTTCGRCHNAHGVGCGARRGRQPGVGAVRAESQSREPLHPARRAAAVDERPGRDHPQGRRTAGGVAKIDELKARYANVAVEGGRIFNPGWHLAIDLRNMLLVSECVAKAALARTESRGGHTRDDFPKMDSHWRNKLLVCRVAPGDAVVPDVTVTPEQQPVMRPDLLATFELSELEKYTPTINWPSTRTGRADHGCIRRETAGVARRRDRRGPAGLHRRA